MNRRDVIKNVSLMGIASIMPLSLKMAAAEAITVEEKIAMIATSMPIGGCFGVIKISETEWTIYGAGVESGILK